MTKRSPKKHILIHGRGAIAIQQYVHNNIIPDCESFLLIMGVVKSRTDEFMSERYMSLINRWGTISPCYKYRTRSHWIALIYDAVILWEIMWNVEKLSHEVLKEATYILRNVLYFDQYILNKCQGIQLQSQMGKKMKKCQDRWESQKLQMYRWIITQSK